MTSGCVVSLNTLWIASSGGGRSGIHSVGGFDTNTMSVLSFLTFGFNGMHQRPVEWSRHPLSMAPLDTVIFVFVVS